MTMPSIHLRVALWPLTAELFYFVMFGALLSSSTTKLWRRYRFCPVGTFVFHLLSSLERIQLLLEQVRFSGSWALGEGHCGYF